MASSQTQISSLHWEETMFGLEPRWRLEPDIEEIKSTLQSLWPSSTIQVAYFAQGAFNKLYQVTIEDQPLLMLRVSLPVDPQYKTLSEVATIRWVHAVTTVPLPQVITYNSSLDTALGFEWILMTRLDGISLSSAWTHIDLSTKSALVRQFASFEASLFRNQLSGIGNIYPPVLSTLTPTTGRIVSMPFFWGDRINLDIDRGPFRHSRDWIAARLQLAESDCLAVLRKYPADAEIDSDAEDDKEDATRTAGIIKKLQQLIDIVFAEATMAEETTVLSHTDLSRSNILVDDAGKLTDVVDWECVSALPLWKACSYPSFPEGRPRHDKPDETRYTQDLDQVPPSLYLEHLLEYELTLLRALFLEEMERVEPRWTAVFNASQLQRDFDLAVEHCDSEFLARDILRWIDDIAGGVGSPGSLREMIDGV
ncbi:APH domain-containing protein [Fusarium sp. LHS14.1]|nr:APH domain-containing protein [Fusarium sp. LHS14.1]